jgi:Flp pilus assembly protein CpaB
MRRGRLMIYIALILIVGLGLVLVLGRSVLFPPQATETIVAEGEATPVPTQPAVKVVVVTQKIQRGESIPADKLDMVEYPEDLVLPNMFTKIEDVKDVVARYDLESYTVLTTNLVAPAVDKYQGSDAALLIDKGMVAVSIPINRLSAISYAPQRGDRVNVIATMLFIDLDTAWQSRLPNFTGAVISPGSGGFASSTANNLSNQQYGLDASVTTSENIRLMLAQPIFGSSPYGRAEEDLTLDEMIYVLPSEYQRPRMVSQTVIRNVMVLQIGNFEWMEKAEPTPTPMLEGTPTSQPQGNLPPTPEATVEPPQPPDVITLVVSPQDAVTLNYLVYSGAQLTLALRNPLDTNDDPTEAVTLQFLLDSYNIPIPVKLPYGLDPRVDVLVSPKLANDLVPTPTP